MRKLNIALLTVLVLFQTILGPFGTYGVTFAAEDNNTPDSTGVEDIIINDVSFEMLINNVKVNGDYATPLSQDQTAKITYVFNTDVTNANKQGSKFTFQLPKTIIDYQAKFKGNVAATEDSPAFKFSTDSNNIVTVELTEDMAPELVVNNLEFKMSFESGFKLDGESLEQTVTYPTGIKTEDIATFTLTFNPKITGSALEKNATGVTIENGERIITWEAWLNKDGQELTNAEIKDIFTYRAATDTADQSGGHELVKNSIKVVSYDVGLKGPIATTASSETPYEDFTKFTLTGKKAYKLTYHTKVNLESPSGNVTFKNKISLTNNGNTTSAPASQGITYGNALEKIKKSGDNYNSSWEIRYNYNLAKIPQGNAGITDTLTGPHEIDLNSVEIYVMNTDNDGKVLETPKRTLTKGTDYTPTLSADKKTLKVAFNHEVTEAYKITYEAKYTEDFYIGNTVVPLINSVVAGLTETPPSGNCTGLLCKQYDLQQAILSKSYTVNFETKEITWTIAIKADNKAIKELTLTDMFNHASFGAHELVRDEDEELTDDITLTGFANKGTLALNTTATQGFIITGAEIVKGNTATITYKTKFAIDEFGQVNTSGYKNSINANWPHENSSKPNYDLIVVETFVPKQNTANNGSKAGTYDYSTQRFTWGIKVNVNKKDIQGAVLTDTLQGGHVIDRTYPLVVKTYTLDASNDDSTGTIGSPIDTSKYEVVYNQEQNPTGFTLTFANDLGDLNNKAYYVEYKTKDADNIVGFVGADNKLTGKYENGATFQTKDTTQFNIGSASVTVNFANELFAKTAKANSADGTYDWTLVVNKSQSNLGDNITVEDTPSENLMLLSDSIQIRKFILNSSGAVSYQGDWVKLDSSKVSEDKATGTFTLNLGTINGFGYEIKYKTLVLDNKGVAFSNKAKLIGYTSDVSTQGTSGEVKSNFAFSKADASASSTKGTLKLNKVGINPATGEKEVLVGVEFALVKTVNGKDYVIDTATTDTNGDFIFNYVRYGKYKLVETKYAGYKNIKDNKIIPKVQEVTLSDETNFVETAENPVVTTVYNEKDVNFCEQFTLTVKDVDGQIVKNAEIILKDQEGKLTDINATTDNNGQIKINHTAENPGFDKIGMYNVYDKNDTENPIGSVKVIFAESECNVSVQPAPSCPNFTVIVKDEDGNVVTNKEVTIKNSKGETVTTLKPKTNEQGEIQFASSNSAGDYKLTYDGKEIPFKVSYKTDCQVTVSPTLACTQFAVFVKDEDGKLITDKKVTIKQGETVIVDAVTPTNGKVELPTNQLAGTYDVYIEGVNSPIGTVKVTYTGNCEDTVQIAPACDSFIIVVKDKDGQLVKNSPIIVKKSNQDEVFNGNTTTSGEVILPNTTSVGTYSVYEGTELIGEVEVTYKGTECKAEVQAKISCTQYEIIIVDRDNNIRSNVEVTLKNAVGDTIATETTDGNGKIAISPTTPPGTYKVYEGTSFIGDVLISYIDSCEATMVPINACPAFTLTVNNLSNTPRENAAITVKDANNHIVASGTTDALGQLTFPYVIKPGTYKVYEGLKLINSFTVTTDCTATVKPVPPPAPDACEQQKTITGLLPGTNVVINDKLYTVNPDGTVTVPGIELPKNATVTVMDELDKPVGIIITDENCNPTFTLAPQACDQDKVVPGLPPNTKVVINEKSYTVNPDGTVTVPGKELLPNTKVIVIDETGKPVGTITVNEDCEGTFTPAAPSCEEGVSITNLPPNTTVTIGDKPYTVDENGKVNVPKGDLPEGTPVTVKDATGKEIGTVTVKDCEGTFTPVAPSCEEGVSITNLPPNTTVTIGDKSYTVDGNGQVNVPKGDLPAGTTTVKDATGKEIGTVTVKDCEGTFIPTVPSCEEGVSITNLPPNTIVTIGDKPYTVDGNGQVNVPKGDLPEGTPVIVKDEAGKEIGTVTVKDCEGTFTPTKSCPQSEVTLVDYAGQVVTITKTGEPAVTAQVALDGKLIIPFTDGFITVVDANGKKIGTTTLVNCTGEFTFTPDKVCEVVTIKLTDYIGQIVTVTDGLTTLIVPVEEDGKTVLPFTNGTITVLAVDGKQIGTVTLVDCEGNFEFTKACTAAELTLVDYANKTVTAEHHSGITTVTFDSNGKVTLPFTNGTVTLKDGDKVIGSINLVDCQGIFTYEKQVCDYPTSVSLPEHAGKEATVTNGTESYTVIVPDDGIVAITFTEGTTTVTVEGTTVSTIEADCTTVTEEVPTNPVTPETPGQPVEPVEPTDPPEPGKPSVPVTPPTNPGEPTNPGTPPTNPGEPTDPGTPPTNPGEPTDPGTPPTNPGEPTDPGTPPTNPGEPTDPGTPPTNPGEPTDPGTPPTNPGEPTDPGTPPTNPGEPIDPGTPPTNPGEPTDPSTPPTNPGEPTDPGTPPTNPGTPSPVTPEQVANIQKIIENPIPNNPEDIKKQIEELKQFIEMFEKLTPEEQAELLRVLGVEYTKLKERLAELERALAAMESKEPTTNGTTAGNNGSTAGESVAKLPQTDGASTTAMLYAGLALMAMSAFFLMRRRKNV